MRHELIAVLGLVLSLNVISNTPHSDAEVEKGIQWLREFYNKSGTPATENKNNVNIENFTKCIDGLKDGVCVKASRCRKEPEKIDPATNFIFRESDNVGNSTSTEKAGCHFLQMCCPVDQVLTTELKMAPEVSYGCGYSNPGANVFRISKDNNKNGYADFGEFRWMVALLKAGTKTWASENYIGGGTLIHPSVVMTAAHKVMQMTADELQCRAGEWETQSENELYIHQDRDVNKIIEHEDFNSLHGHNDIALLIVKEPFIMEPHINVACLSPMLPPAGTECYSMGWGEDLTKSKQYAIILKKISLPLVKARTCEMRYRNSRLGHGYYLHQSLTCAGGEAMVDTCIGDGGSSLVCPIGDPKDERYQVVGMVAYGLECGTMNLPGVYVNVPYLYSWINQQMSLQNLNKSSYIY